MADEFGIDVGNVLARVEDIKAARIRNKFAPKDAELAQQANVMQNDMAALQLQQARRAEGDIMTERGARGDAAKAAGLPAPQAALVTINPAKAQELSTFFNNLDEDQRKTYAQNVEDMGKAAAYIKTSKDPEAAFLEVKGMLSPELQKKLPATYDADFVDMALAQALEVKDILSGGGGKKSDAPSGYEWNPDGSLKPIKGGPHDPATKTGGGLETAAANGIRSTVALAFGGEFNPATGEFSVMDPNEASQMIDVIALAQEKMIANPSLAPGRAVEQALKEAGVQPAGGNAMAGGGEEVIKVDAAGNVIE